MRVTRRGCFAARKEPKYVWAVYAVGTGYHADESTAPYTSTFTLSSTYRYKMAAKAYTATATTFTLTDPVQTTRANLAAGDYLVDVSTSSSTAVSGSYLYKITAISGSTFTYTRWQPVAYEQKTGAELYRVESETMDYPIDGPQENLWYVMVKGEYSVYVWSQYHATSQYVQRSSSNEKIEKNRGSAVTIYYYWSGQLIFSANCSFDSKTGIYSLENGYKSETVVNFMNFSGSMTGAWMIDSPSGSTAYSGFSSRSADYVNGVTVYTSELTHTKNDYIGTVESDRRSAYPTNSYQGDYWYTYSHSYLYTFDNR